MTTEQSTIELSIIIPTTNSVNTLRRLVNAVSEQFDNTIHEVIFLDTESTDGTREYIDSIPFNQVQRLDIRKADFSHSRTRMLGAQVARGRMVIFFSDDVVPLGDNFLAELSSPVACGHAAASFGVSMICPATGDPLRASRYNHWYTDRPDIVQPIPKDRWESLTPDERNFLCRFDDCASCYDRNILLRVGFPDVPYGEDIAIAKKLLLSGHSLALAKQAKFYHWHKYSFNTLLRRMCIDQILIKDLFGLSYVPHATKLLAIVFLQSCLYLVLGLTVSGIKTGKRLYWIAYSIKYIVADNLGKYLGGLKGKKLHCWNIVDHFLVKLTMSLYAEVLRDSVKRN